MKMLFQRCSVHENMKKKADGSQILDSLFPAPRDNHGFMASSMKRSRRQNTITPLSTHSLHSFLVCARLLGCRGVSHTGYSLNPKQIGFRRRRREASSAWPSPRRRRPVNRQHMAAGGGRGLRACATYVVRRLRGDIPGTPPPPPEHGDGIDRRRSHFCSLNGQKKWEGDSCQSSLIVAPLNSGVNGFLPDVNTA